MQQQRINKLKSPGCTGRLWTNTLLERLSVRLAVKTVQIGQVSFASRSGSPSHYAYDVMLPLAHASEEEPLGWVLFGAKYMHNETMIAVLRKHVVAELPGHKWIDMLADLVVVSYCTGRRISEREVRRTLHVGQGKHLQYHQANERILANLAAVEANYARLVKKYL